MIPLFGLMDAENMEPPLQHYFAVDFMHQVVRRTDENEFSDGVATLLDAMLLGL